MTISKTSIKIKKYLFLVTSGFLLSMMGCSLLPSFKNDCQPVQSQLVDGSFWVDISKYGTSSAKSLIIVPPTGRTNYIDRRYAEKFCSAGYSVIILDQWMGDTEPESFDLGMHQRFYERADKSIALAIGSTHSKFIGLLGTSVGALHAGVAASTQPQLNAVFIITGGAMLAEIIVNSDQQAMIDLAKKRAQEYGYKNKEEYLKALLPNIKLDPMLLGDGYKSKKLGMMIALQDTTVPTEFQNKLANYWKPSVVIQRSTGHFWGIVDTWLFDSEKVLDFFESSLKN